jgi:hypothetical protein
MTFGTIMEKCQIVLPIILSALEFSVQHEGVISLLFITIGDAEVCTVQEHG